jgi:integrase
MLPNAPPVLDPSSTAGKPLTTSLAGTPLHVVSRRLGHRSVQTTTNTYAHVTADAELAVLSNSGRVVQGWGVLHD